MCIQSHLFCFGIRTACYCCGAGKLLEEMSTVSWCLFQIEFSKGQLHFEIKHLVRFLMSFPFALSLPDIHSSLRGPKSNLLSKLRF